MSDVTLTINPVPADSTVTLVATGYEQSGNSITVPEGTTVSYKVEKDLYNTVKGLIAVPETVTLSVNLNDMFKFTVAPSPADSTVTLTSIEGYVQDGKSIVVPNGATVTYTVSHASYATSTGTYTVTGNVATSIILTQPIITDINIIAENLSELLTNSVNQVTKFYDIFINPVEMDVELQMYNDENELITVTVPNRAKDRKVALSGSGSPEGVVTANVGATYVDIVQRKVYFKTQGTGNTGWTVVPTTDSMESVFAAYLVANNYMTDTLTGEYLTNHNYINRTALDTVLASFVPTAYMNELSTSGTLNLQDNSAYRISPTGTVTFVLPIITDLTKVHKILVQINMGSTVYSITPGTLYYFDRIAPDISVANTTYNLLYEYDNSAGYWVVGGIQKGTNA